MNQLPIFVNLRGRKVILLGQGEMADAKRRLYERAGAQIIDDEQGNAALAVVAIEDDAKALAAVERLKKRGLLVNAVDRSHLCDYTTPAIVDRDPVLIAIGTGGASAGLAKALRQRLEQMLPASLGNLAKALHAAKDRIKTVWPDGSDRRRAIDAVLNPNSRLDPFQDFEDASVSRWLDNPEGDDIGGVIDIDLTSDNPDDLTIRQARLLRQADVIMAADNVNDDILNRARADAERLPMTDDVMEAMEGLVLRIKFKMNEINGLNQIEIVTILQTALAPAFLLVALGAMLGLFAGRLARIIDRSRDLQEQFKTTKGREHDLIVSELRDIQLRIKAVNSAIFLSVVSAIIACIMIGLLFIMGLIGVDLSMAIAGAFIIAISLLSFSLVQFLREVRIGTRDFLIREEFLEDMEIPD